MDKGKFADEDLEFIEITETRDPETEGILREEDLSEGKRYHRTEPPANA